MREKEEEERINGYDAATAWTTEESKLYNRAETKRARGEAGRAANQPERLQVHDTSNKERIGTLSTTTLDTVHSICLYLHLLVTGLDGVEI